MSKRLRNYLLVIVLTLCSVATIAAGAAYYLIARPEGGQKIVDFLLLQTARYGSVNVETVHGTVGEGLSLKNVIIRNSPFLGRGGQVRIQRVDVQIPFLKSHLWQKRDVQISFFNGRMDLKDCDPILFNGHYSDGQLEINAYSKNLSIPTIMRTVLPPPVPRYVEGWVSAVDLTFKGNPLNPRVTGHFYIDRIHYLDRMIREGLVRIDLLVNYREDQLELQGPIVMESGIVEIQNTVIELQKSMLSFKKDIMNPTLAIFGSSTKDMYTIDLKITGTLRKPEMHVHSDPYLPEETALMVLGLGKWAPSDFQLQYDADVRKMEVKKKLTSDVNVGFEYEELPARVGQQAENTKTLQSALSLSEKFSLNLDEKFSTSYDSALSGTQSRSQEESRLYLKYKNNF
jgi:hypothetical protein